MKLAVRPSTPADASALGALLAQARMDPDPEHLRWKYWQPRADWTRPRSLVISEGSELVAHVGIVPGACVFGTQRVTLIHVIDWVALEGRPGTGVLLLRSLGKMAEAMLGIGGGMDTTQRLLPSLGFRSSGELTGYARALFPIRLLRGGATLKLVPRLARALRQTATASPGVEWQARRLEGEEVDRIASVLPVPTPGMAVTERSTGLFRYLLGCPILPMSLYAVEQGGRVRGYFLLASSPGQVRIADCWMDSVDPADWRALILCAIERARHDRAAAEVVAWASDPTLAEALSGCGFRPRFRSPIRVRGPVPDGPLRVQMVDSDVAYLLAGGFEYWG